MLENDTQLYCRNQLKQQPQKVINKVKKNKSVFFHENKMFSGRNSYGNKTLIMEKIVFKKFYSSNWVN